MKYYVNCLKRSDALQIDIKQLIPEMNIRRRMSRLVKMGVCTGLESLIAFEEFAAVDAIITSTSLGVIGDSEKFLSNIITADERMLNPTPFIQSTFNTIGAQIALITKKHCYNNTFVHRNSSFESALLEATLRIECGSSKAVLVGLFDEITPTVESISRRLGLLNSLPLGEGAMFFVLSSERYSCSVAEIDLTIDDMPQCGVKLSDVATSYWSGAIAIAVAEAIENGENYTIVNDMNTTFDTAIKINIL